MAFKIELVVGLEYALAMNVVSAHFVYLARVVGQKAHHVFQDKLLPFKASAFYLLKSPIRFRNPMELNNSNAASAFFTFLPFYFLKRL